MNKSNIVQVNDYELLWPGLDIKYLVLSTKEFIVFIDSELMIDWKTSDDYDCLGPKCQDKHNSVLNRAASVECIPNEHQKEKIRLNFKRMLAEGVARSLKHDYENAYLIINESEKYINNRNIEIARFWQLCTTFISGIVTSVIIITAWIFRAELADVLGEIPFRVVISALFGSLGATLSVIFRIGKANITSEAEKRLHILESLSRNLGGAISGVIISVLVNLGVIVPIFKNANMSATAMIAAAFIAGASERWVPSLIEQYEKGGK